MEIRVVTDIMAAKGRYDILATAAFEDACFFADEFEGGADASLREQVAQTFGRVIVGRQQVILRIKQEDDVNSRRLQFRGVCRTGNKLTGYDSQEKNQEKIQVRTDSDRECLIRLFRAATHKRMPIKATRPGFEAGPEKLI